MASGKYVHLLYMYSYLVGAPFALITASIQRGMEVISLWHAEVVWKPRFSLTVAFSSSALFGSGSLIFLWQIPHRFSMGFRSGEFAGQSSTVTPWSLNQLLVPLAVVGRCQVLLENEISISIKPCQQKEAWSALKFPGRLAALTVDFRKHVDQHQQKTWQPKSSLTVETSHWTSSNMDSVPLHSSSRLWDLDFQMKCKIYFHLKRGLWTTEQSPVLFLHSPGKMLLTLSLVQKWLGSPFPEDVWAWWLLMHWLQLQSTPCEALTSVWISFAWQYSQACNHPCYLCTFSYPNSSFQSTLHLICFDTALCKQPPLSVMTFCDLPSLWRVSMFVFWIIAKSAVFSIIVVSEQEIPRIYTVWMVINGNSNVNILIFWDIDFWLSWAVSSNHQN